MTFRTSGLAIYGLSDDEVRKVHAAAYSRGDFTVNAEHPVLMKLAVWASLSAADRWNRIAPPGYVVPLEAAVRFPNAILGTASVLVIYGVAHAYFGTRSLLPRRCSWRSIRTSRRSTAWRRRTPSWCSSSCWFYERGKQVGVRDTQAVQPYYMGRAAAFGLMLASKSAAWRR